MNASLLRLLIAVPAVMLCLFACSEKPVEPVVDPPPASTRLVASPDSAFPGDRVRISGPAFTGDTSVVVRIGGIVVAVDSVGSDFVIVIIPPDAVSGEIVAELRGITWRSGTSFTVKQPAFRFSEVRVEIMGVETVDNFRYVAEPEDWSQRGVDTTYLRPGSHWYRGTFTAAAGGGVANTPDDTLELTAARHEKGDIEGWLNASPPDTGTTHRLRVVLDTARHLLRTVVLSDGHRTSSGGFPPNTWTRSYAITLTDIPTHTEPDGTIVAEVRSDVAGPLTRFFFYDDQVRHGSGHTTNEEATSSRNISGVSGDAYILVRLKP